MSRRFTDDSKYHKIEAQLGALQEEIGILSKKKPDDAVNEFKLAFINQVLREANAALDKDHLPFAEFTTFDKDACPTNSDVVMILAQYLRCFRRQRVDRGDF